MKFTRETLVRSMAEEINSEVATNSVTKASPKDDGQLAMSTRLVTLDVVAQALGVSKRYVQKLVQRKAIPVIRLGKRCPRFDLNRVLAAVKRFEVEEMTLR